MPAYAQSVMFIQSVNRLWSKENKGYIIHIYFASFLQVVYYSSLWIGPFETSKFVPVTGCCVVPDFVDVPVLSLIHVFF